MPIKEALIGPRNSKEVPHQTKYNKGVFHHNYRSLSHVNSSKNQSPPHLLSFFCDRGVLPKGNRDSLISPVRNMSKNVRFLLGIPFFPTKECAMKYPIKTGNDSLNRLKKQGFSCNQ